MGWFYRVGSRLFELFFRLWAVDLRVYGHENIPSTGPAVLAANHISYLDFAFVMLAPPRPRRPVHFLARKEFFDVAPLGWFLRKVGQIPVDVHGDPLRAADATRQCLLEGGLVGIHPEGTISPSFTLRRAKSGAVRVAESADAPIIPVALWGSQRLMTKWRKVRPPRHVTVIIRYGEPFHPQGRTAALRTREVMDRIQALLEQCQQEYPLQPASGEDWWLPAALGGSAMTPDQAEERLAAQAAKPRPQASDGGPPSR